MIAEDPVGTAPETSATSTNQPVSYGQSEVGSETGLEADRSTQHDGTTVPHPDSAENGTDPDYGHVDGSGPFLEDTWTQHTGTDVYGDWVTYQTTTHDHSGPYGTLAELTVGCRQNTRIVQVTVPWETKRWEVISFGKEQFEDHEQAEQAHQTYGYSNFYHHRDDVVAIIPARALYRIGDWSNPVPVTPARTVTQPGNTTMSFDLWFEGEGEGLYFQTQPKEIEVLGTYGVVIFGTSQVEEILASLPCFQILNTWGFSRTRTVESDDGTSQQRSTYMYYTNAFSHTGTNTNDSPQLQLWCEPDHSDGSAYQDGGYPQVNIKIPWKNTGRVAYRSSGTDRVKENFRDEYEFVGYLAQNPGEILYIKSEPEDGSHTGEAEFDITNLRYIIGSLPCWTEDRLTQLFSNPY